MHSFIKLAAATALSFFGLLIPLVSFSQEIEGPVSVSPGESAHYHLFDDAVVQTPNFNLSSGGSITGQTHTSFNHDADVTWGSTPGVYTLQFRRGTSVLITLDVTVTCPSVKIPVTNFSYAATCTGVDITRLSSPSAGITWYWQSTATGTSTSNSTLSYTYTGGTASDTVFVRAYQGGCWSAFSKATAVIPGTGTTAPGSVCVSGTVNLSATIGTNGTTVKWYASCAGGTALATSTTYTTPSISATTTYYAATYNSTSTVESARVAVTATVSLLPTTFNVTGSGTYCPTGSGLTATLTGSQSGVNYQLKKNGVNEEAAKPGTGSPLTWINKPAGTYTVVATNSNGTCPVSMGNSAVITLINPGGTVAGVSTCSSSSPTLTLSGHSGTVVRWEKSSNGTSWSPVFGTAGLTSPNINTNGTFYYRAIVNNATCGDVPSSSVQVYGFSPGQIDGWSTTCTGPASGTLQLSNYPSTGTITVHRWEYSTNSGSTWTQILPNVTGTSYTYSGVSVTTIYQALVSWGSCAARYSSIGQVAIIPNPGGTVSGVSTCSSSSPTLTLSGHSGTVVRWEKSSNGTSWSPVFGTAGLTSPNINTNGTFYYRAIVNNATCGDVPSSSVQVYGFSPGQIDGWSTTCTGPASGTLQLSNYPSTGTITVHRWEYSTNSGSTWTQILPNVTGTSYTYSGVSVTTIYQALVSWGSCAARYSSIGQVAIIPNPGGTVSGVSTCSSSSPTLTLSGHSGTVVRWEKSSNGTSWSPVFGTAGLTSPNINTNGTFYYRAIVNNATCGDVPSSSVQVYGFSPGQIDGWSTTCTGPASGTLQLSNYPSTGTITVHRWEYSTNSGSTWTQVLPNVTSTSYTYSGVSVTTIYQALVSWGSCAARYSSIGQVAIIPNPGGTVSGVSTCSSSSPTLTLSGHSGTVVRWEKSSNGTSWSPVFGTAGLTSPNINTNGTFYYRAIVNNATCGDVPSSSVQVYGFSPGQIDGWSTTCTGPASGTLQLSNYPSTGTITVHRWEYSTNSGSTWTQVLPNVTSTSYNYSGVSVTTIYQALVSWGSCAARYSSVGQVAIGVGCRNTPDPPLSASWANDDAQITLTHQPSKGTQLSLQRSSDGLTFKDIGAEWTNADDNDMLAIDHNVWKLKIPILHYRVKFVNQEIDSYSEVVQLERNILGETVQVFPNPANTSININSIDTEDLISVSIIDQLGRLVYERTAASEIQFDVSELPSGLYFVMLHYEIEGKKAVKVVIAH